MVLLAGIVFQVGTTRQARAQISPGPLARAHQSLDGPLNCLKCHAGKSEAMDRACLNCHAPIAALRSQDRGLHAANAGKECATCHPDHAGRDFDLIRWEGGSPRSFDHAGAGWPLEGKHLEAECRDCHRPEYQKAPYVKDIPEGRRAESWLGLERECRSCHQDVHAATLGTDCAACHTAAAFRPAARFDHAKSAFPLTGKHAKVECAACHRTTQTVTMEAGISKALAVFKPQPHAECSACHKDPHQARLGPKCSECHGTDDFKRVSRDDFDHGRTRYPLAGRHAALDCALCHDPVKAWGPRPAFKTCADCHRDPHAGEATLAGRPADCALCHDVAGFRPSTFTAARHDSTKYPLQGRHRTVACAGCHPKNPAHPKPGAGIVSLRPEFAACRDCHAEAHARQLSGRPDQGACETCHAPAGWKPSLFDATRHAALKLPLDGRHAEIGCAECHGPKRHDLPPLPPAEVLGTARVALVLPGAACTDCHLDVHALPTAAARPGRGPAVLTGGGPAAAPCLQCHTTAAFRPSRVNAAIHRDYAFPLVGAHKAVPCRSCHASLDRPRPKSTLRLAQPAATPLPFGQESKICADCHRTPHGAQFEGRRGGDACEACHDVDAFIPPARFDHNRDAAFSLKGAHQNVACAKCHPSRPGPDARPQVLYRPVDARCESCHAKGSVKP